MTIFVRNVIPKIEDQNLEKLLNDQDQILDTVLNKGLSFGDNFDGVFVTFTSSATPDAENTVTHTLGKIPTGFIVTNINKASVVYANGTAWTAANIYLKVNVASTAITIFVF